MRNSQFQKNYANQGLRQHSVSASSPISCLLSTPSMLALAAVLMVVLSVGLAVSADHGDLPVLRLRPFRAYLHNNHSEQAQKDRSGNHVNNNNNKNKMYYPMLSPLPLSLKGACSREIQQLCGDHSAQQLHCLLHHYSQLAKGGASNEGNNNNNAVEFSRVCSAWIDARDSCVSAVRLPAHHHHHNVGGLRKAADSHSHCYVHERVRDCLRRVPASTLPAACANSDYYHSVLASGKLKEKRYRRHRK